MNCFPCFQKKENSDTNNNNENIPVAEVREFTTPPPPANTNKHHSPSPSLSSDPISKGEASYGGEDGSGNSSAKAFTFRELAMATKNFRQECLLGEGGFGRVFKGTLQSGGQVVAVRQLDRSGTLPSKEFLSEVSMLSHLEHPNLVKLIGYCADGDQRILVYEFIPTGSLSSLLFDIPANKKPLDWSTRMKIAAGIAEGLEYLHETANPPIIYRDLKSSNILLDDANNPRLSEYGLAKLMQSGNKMQVAPRVMGGYGYCAPEYEMHGELTLKSDVYSFGVVLLELITGRKAMDDTQPINEQNLVSWAQPIFSDPKRFPDMADPNLKKHFPVTSLNQAVGVAAMCLQDEPMVRPLITDIVAALSFLVLAPPEAPIPERLVSILSGRVSTSSMKGIRCSLDLSNISQPKKEGTSDNKHKHKKNHSRKAKDRQKEHDGSSASESDSSASSDDEGGRKVKPSVKWALSPKKGSDSKRKSMRSISRSSSSRRSSNTNDYSSDSSSDEESLRRRSHDRNERIHSRSGEENSMNSDDDDDDDDGSEFEYS